MGSRPDKVVQTELSAEEYEELRELADEEGKSLKELLRDAARAHIRAKRRPDPDDPLFTAPAGNGEATDAARTDEYLYE